VHIYSRKYACEVKINRVINDENKLKLTKIKSPRHLYVPCNELITFKSDFVFKDICVNVISLTLQKGIF
jgi:hypothetical protein